MRRSLLPPVLLACLSGAACSRTSTAAASENAVPVATLAFTSHVRGWVEPCGCTADPLGGVDRIKAELDRTRARTPTLFFDVGSLLFDHEELAPAALCQEDARVKMLLGSAQQSGLQFTGLGVFDLSRGEPWRAQALQAAGIPALSANVQGATGVLPRLLREVGGIKVGFTGVTWPAGSALPGPLDAALSWRGVQLHNPLKAVAQQAGLLRQEGAQVVVVVSQMARAQSVKLAQDVPGLDLLLQGHEPGEEPLAPQEVARGTWMISSGQQGQYLGKINLRLPSLGQSCCLVLDDNGAGARQEAERLKKRARQMEEQALDFDARKDAANAAARRKKAGELTAQADAMVQAVGTTAKGANTFSFEGLPLNSSVAPDAAVQATLKAYKASLKDLNAACEKNVECPKAAPGKPSYVGTQNCKGCHEEAYAFWQKSIHADPVRARQRATQPDHPNRQGVTGHARAWLTLEEKGATGNRDCVGCHAVGFEKPGGFCKLADAPTWGNVSCENCHGPGSIHADSEERKDILGQVPEATCRGCHQVPHIPSTESFVYADKLRNILGPGHGEQRLQALQGK
jgi:2',3'-cyclic-nucleotide 2'-phosphodiesterase (5'-nucleotidase family)